MDNEKLAEIVELVEEALFTDGGHHKQWYFHFIIDKG